MAVGDLLESKKESGEYADFKIKYNKTIDIAEEVARDKDLELGNTNNKASKLIKKVSDENNIDFMRDLFPYMIRYQNLRRIYQRG